MKRHFLVIITVLMALLSYSAVAQDTQLFKNRLAMPNGESGARVVVVERGDAAAAVKEMDSYGGGGKINGYRVRIFFDNSQNARSGAGATQASFSELFPDVPVYMSYENPYFKVTAGNCLTNEEAIILWGRVKHSFGTAFVIRESIDISVFGD